MKAYKRDFYTGVVLLVFCGLYYWQTLSIKVFTGIGATFISASTVPQMWAAALGLMSVLLLIRSIRAYAKDPDKKEASGVSISLWFQDHVNALLTFVLLFVYAFAFSRLGYLLSTLIYIICQIPLLTEKEKRTKALYKKSVIISVIVSISTAFLFVEILKVPLPRGILGF